ncbi:hypothetical protein FRC14_007547 [Serendipita sp. 396]|nr:hypothetical protein FRC14_007547 [Serendipita sp. 396]
MPMPIFALAFGSFGDISQCVQLLWKIGKDVGDTAGSSEEYQALKAELTQTIAVLNDILLLRAGSQTSDKTRIGLEHLQGKTKWCYESIEGLSTQETEAEDVISNRFLACMRYY